MRYTNYINVIIKRALVLNKNFK